MPRLAALGLVTLIACAALCGLAMAQTTTTGSTGCTTITQAAANGLAARIQADDNDINPPKSVTQLTCLTNFFNGSGLDLISTLLDPTTLLTTVEGKICSLVQQTWNSLLGKVQCGRTIKASISVSAVSAAVSPAQNSRSAAAARRLARSASAPDQAAARPLHQRHRPRANRLQPPQRAAGYVLMRHFTLAAAPAIGIAILVNAAPAYADLPTIDVTVQGAVNAVKDVLSTINGYIQDIKTFLGPSGPIETTLLQGFTQNANYQKAAVGASEQIADASNTANARFKRDMRNAQLRDEHTPSPNACTALDNGVSTQAASVQAFTVAATIAKIHDQRTEAGPNMPSYYGQAQAVASINQQHLSLYCDANDVAAGLCGGISTIPDADQQFSSPVRFGNLCRPECGQHRQGLRD